MSLQIIHLNGNEWILVRENDWKFVVFSRATRHYTRMPCWIRTIRINHKRFVTINWHLVNDIWNQGDFPKPLLNVELRRTILKVAAIWWYFWCFTNAPLWLVIIHWRSLSHRNWTTYAACMRLVLSIVKTVIAIRCNCNCLLPKWLLIHLLKFKNLLRRSSAEADCSSF